MKRIRSSAARCCVAFAAAALCAAAEEPPHTYALVSAVGGTLSYVKPRFSTGTHLEAFQRAELKVPDTTIDAAALRGLEKVVRLSRPDREVRVPAAQPERIRRRGTRPGRAKPPSASSPPCSTRCRSARTGTRSWSSRRATSPTSAPGWAPSSRASASTCRRSRRALMGQKRLDRHRSFRRRQPGRQRRRW